MISKFKYDVSRITNYIFLNISTVSDHILVVDCEGEAREREGSSGWQWLRKWEKLKLINKRSEIFFVGARGSDPTPSELGEDQNSSYADHRP